MPKTDNTIPIKKLVTRNGKSFVTIVYVSLDKYHEHLRKTSQSSKEKYTDKNGKYTPEREKQHIEIIDNIVESCPKPLNGAKPTAILLLGGAASGKSTVVNKFIKPQLKDGFGTINADDIKESLGGYKKYMGQDVITAAYRIHEESSDIAKQVNRKVIEEGRNFIFDAVLGDPEKAKKLIADLKEKGYNVKLVGVNVNVKDALERAKSRAFGNESGKSGSGRYVPDKILIDGHRGSAETFEKIKDLVDSVELYDNNVQLGEDPIKVMDGDKVYRPDLYKNFKEKRNITSISFLAPALVKSWIDKIKGAFQSQSTTSPDETGQEIQDIDISRRKLYVLKSNIEDILRDRDEIHENHSLAKSELLDISKANVAVQARLPNQIGLLENGLFNELKDNTKVLNKSYENFKKALEDHVDLLRDGDFVYKKYLPTSLGRTRDTMPQIDSSDLDEILIHFGQKSPNSKISKINIKLCDLKLIQNEINEDKLLSILYDFDVKKIKPLLISKENIIIDGSHTFSTAIEIDETAEVLCYKINLPINEALRRLNLMKVSSNLSIDQ